MGKMTEELCLAFGWGTRDFSVLQRVQTGNHSAF